MQITAHNYLALQKAITWQMPLCVKREAGAVECVRA